ncbi:signal transduction histidine kinase [Massilia aurea]|uniref:Signal transduction histidine kinase n=1 Tax=Massilia aurea TaxID=373040 RepID=A0A7X0CFS0_9BURK|nr:histidine kinase [Massilia aurea]MBB6135388.1 signal transduction histidine kinase [Massilia aurea]
MWGRVANWWTEWEQELLAVLKTPGLADQAPAGWRRAMACKAAKLSHIERQEVYRISVTYRGWALVRLLAKLCLVFSVFGALVKMAFLPKLSMLGAVVAANGVGLGVLTALVGIWFNHEKYSLRGGKLLANTILLGMLGGLFGSVVAMIFRGGSWARLLESAPRVLMLSGFGVLVLVVLPGFVLATVRNRHYALLALKLEQDAEQARLARELSETQLRLLRAQIEPHFLFNTLGAVQQLAEQGAPRAAELTAHLIDFLRASMSDMRCEQVSLATEFGLVESYLAVMQIRMGERLRFRIDLPTSLAATRIPSMLVLTLAENAIKHGIEPSLRGGEITVTAQEDANHIRIAVHDSGVGMSDTPGNGTGLENVRSRLRLAYGESASLALSEAEPGLLAELLIPRKDAQ